MIASEPISRLAESLRRARSGEGATAEVVQWLRASCSAAAKIPRPQTSDPHRDYTRTLLFKNDLFEILALHWAPNCTSAIHDHGGALCWLTVARGSMGVENYLRTDSGSQAGFAAIALEGREELGPGAVDYRQDDVHLHRCIARDDETVTLHVYARPIERFHAFDERSNSCRDVISTYDATLPL
jgi:predicted metal-dependent enzyme (double-stranded beta helix superfamily)